MCGHAGGANKRVEGNCGKHGTRPKPRKLPPGISRSALLKTDGCGQVCTPSAQREALLDAFERSRLACMKFARRHGVNCPEYSRHTAQGCEAGGTERAVVSLVDGGCRGG